MNKPFDASHLRHVFLQEAEDGLATMEQALLTLEVTPEAREPIDEVFRIVHTIKGGAAMVEFSHVASYTHKLEDALVLLREGNIPVTPAGVTVLLQIVDALRQMLGAEVDGRMKQVRSGDLALISRLIPAEVTAGDDGSAVAESLMELSQAGVAAGPGARARSLRVNMTTLDALLNLSGEITVARGRLQQAMASGHAEDATSAAETLGSLLASLHEQVTALRLVAVGPLFRQHLRTVRDIAAQQGKLVRVEIEGEDVGVDASIVDQLRDPVTHLVRNAVDHGVEYPAVRRDAGKDPCATITLHARHDRGTVVLEVRDDGAGLSSERLVARARARGLIGDGDVLTQAQAYNLILLPGFSTAEQVTEISGRGVGMDVVRRHVEAVRGSVEIVAAPDAGTTVRLRVPLTVAIIDGFVVGVEGERFVIPVDAVTECLTMPDDAGIDRTGVINLRGQALPFVRLRDLLAVGGQRPRRESILVVHHDGRHGGLVVDHLHGEMQAVIKPLDGVFRGVPGLAGTTVMGDGRISLILDVGHLLGQLSLQN